jgi:preprotein translocase subunit SecG
MILFLIIFQVISAILLVGIILLQHGKGADIGSAFGSGSSNPMLGPIDSTNLLTKVTWVLVAVFFVVTISISIVQKNEISNEFDFLIDQNNTDQIEEEIIQELPE